MTAALSVVGCEAVTVVELNCGALLELDARSRTEAGPFWCGVFEEDYRSVLSELCRVYGGSFYDVGANVGLILVPVSLTLPASAIVVGFEPVSANAARLRRNVGLNSLPSVELLECALGSAPGILTIERESAHGATSGNAVLVPEDMTASGRSVESEQVPVRTLDEVVRTQSLAQPNVIKLDVEGSEVAFLEGARETLDAARPIILGEFNSGYMPRFGTTFLDAVRVLPSDYAVFSFTSGRSVVEKEPCVGLGDVLLVPREKIAALPLGVELR